MEEPVQPAGTAAAGPPDRMDVHFTAYGKAARPAIMAEYNRTLRVYRETGVLDVRQREDYSNGDGGRLRAQALYNANRDAITEIRQWQAGTWGPPIAEEETCADSQISEEDSSLDSVVNSDATDQEDAEDATDIRPGIPQAAFAQARERLDRLKLRLAKVEHEKTREKQRRAAKSSPPAGRVLIRGVEVDAGQRSLLHSYRPTVPQLDIARTPAELPDDIDTERLLNALIGECHFLMREVAFASMCQSAVLEDRMDWMKAAMNLATTGAKVAKSVARLRHGPPVKETRHAMVIENKVAAVVQGVQGEEGCANP